MIESFNRIKQISLGSVHRLLVLISKPQIVSVPVPAHFFALLSRHFAVSGLRDRDPLEPPSRHLDPLFVPLLHLLAAELKRLEVAHDAVRQHTGDVCALYGLRGKVLKPSFEDQSVEKLRLERKLTVPANHACRPVKGNQEVHRTFLTFEAQRQSVLFSRKHKAQGVCALHLDFEPRVGLQGDSQRPHMREATKLQGLGLVDELKCVRLLHKGGSDRS